MAHMTGGLHSSRQRQRDKSLAERVDGPGAKPNGAMAPKPCWLAPHAEPVAAHVLGWVPDATGAWRAIVVLEVAAADVAPRPDPGSGHEP